MIRANKIFTIEFLISLLLLFPSFFGYLNPSFGQILFTLISLSVFVVYLLVYNPQFKVSKIFVYISILFISLVLSYLTTILCGAVSSSVSLRDMFDISRPILYWIYFTISMLVFRRFVEEGSLNLTFIFKIILLLSVFDIIKFIPQAIYLLKLYTPFAFGSVNYIRFSGSLGYCYVYGFLIIFAFSYYLFDSKASCRKITLIISFLLLVLTGSRSILIGTFALLLIFFITSSMSIIKKIIILCAIIALLPVVYTLLLQIDSPLIQSTLGYVDRLLIALTQESGATDGSLVERTRQSMEVVEALKQNFWFGIGPTKDKAPIEIMIGYYLASWGVIGTFIYLLILIFFFYIAFVTSMHVTQYNAFSKANCFWIISIIFVGLSTPIIDQIKISQIFFLIQGLQLNIYYLKQ